MKQFWCSAALLCAAIQAAAGQGQAVLAANCDWREGAVIRGPRDERRLSLVFTGDEFAEGAETILNEFARHHGHGSFFLTGHFLTNQANAKIIQRIIHEGHYLGPHSDQHLLYCSWEEPSKMLVSKSEFESDLEANFKKLVRAGVDRRQIKFFLPPYEHYDRTIAGWTKARGLTLVNFTPGTRANADYTGENDKNFVSSQAIFDSIVAQEKSSPEGLSGFLLLLHLGAGPGRIDKFHTRFGRLLDELKAYRLERIDELLPRKGSK